jgi:hypothetical protein
VLEPRSASLIPEQISDGGGLQFSPHSLGAAPAQLDPDDPAVVALAAHLKALAAPKRTLLKRGPAPQPPAAASLDGWRLLARVGDEALFGRGVPPNLLTLAFRLEQRRGNWVCVGESAARPLRASRDGIRASSWRLDPTTELREDTTTLRVLLTEQTFAGGKRADGRVLAPDLYTGAEQLVLTMYVTPLPGFKTRSPNPETPVRVALPEPVGPRELFDGALYERT